MVDYTDSHNMTSFATRTIQQGAEAKADNRSPIHDFISQQLPQNGHPLAPAAAHHFQRPGKMLRAQLALSAAKKMGADKQASLYWAASVELLHNASLVHDDMCDDDAVRRGRPSVWSIYGRNTALALGDWMIARAFDCAANAARHGDKPALVSLLAEHMLATTKGQSLEFVCEDYPAWDAYLETCTGKQRLYLLRLLKALPYWQIVMMSPSRYAASLQLLGQPIKSQMISRMLQARMAPSSLPLILCGARLMR